MAWSQLRNDKAAAVEALLDGLSRDPEELRFLGHDEAADIIHAVIWMHAARSGSTASVYASTALANALGPDRLRALLGLCDGV